MAVWACDMVSSPTEMVLGGRLSPGIRDVFELVVGDVMSLEDNLADGELVTAPVDQSGTLACEAVGPEQAGLLEADLRTDNSHPSETQLGGLYFLGPR